MAYKGRLKVGSHSIKTSMKMEKLLQSNVDELISLGEQMGYEISYDYHDPRVSHRTNYYYVYVFFKDANREFDLHFTVSDKDVLWWVRFDNDRRNPELNDLTQFKEFFVTIKQKLTLMDKLTS